MNQLIKNILQWAEDRDILHPENKMAQYAKVQEELLETFRAVLNGNEDEIKDGLGDIGVTLIIWAKQNGYDIEECIAHAYEEIKNRKGKKINGEFVKESTLKVLQNKLYKEIGDTLASQPFEKACVIPFYTISSVPHSYIKHLIDEQSNIVIEMGESSIKVYKTKPF
jgi:NTP pyrophosphatase (non-canonical NTP hydrolase)